MKLCRIHFRDQDRVQFFKVNIEAEGEYLDPFHKDAEPIPMWIHKLDEFLVTHWPKKPLDSILEPVEPDEFYVEYELRD